MNCRTTFWEIMVRMSEVFESYWKVWIVGGCIPDARWNGRNSSSLRGAANASGDVVNLGGFVRDICCFPDSELELLE